MYSISDNSDLVQSLLEWFRLNGRDLPWRRTYDPYHVWISEIMLQQTQMDRGVEYFLRWVERFPDVASVAKANEQEILKYWQGLGYYARARNLHSAAKKIQLENNGDVPCDYEQLLLLPGIGPYTAAAIASVAGNRNVAVVDANVSRVYARLYDIKEPVKSSRAQKEIAAIANGLLPLGRARMYNQALMDFGGLVCRPKKPLCEECFLSECCMAFQAGIVAERPVTSPTKKSVNIKKVAAVIVCEGKFFIQQRQVKAVWGGLWEFPGGELKATEGQEEILCQKVFDTTGLRIKVLEPITTVLHQYTHHKITLYSYLCAIDGTDTRVRLQDAGDFRWVYPDEIDDFGFPAGPRMILEFIQSSNPELLS
ncbi:MAG: A/G-specific adenine glycosylase [Desulforhopalus sp.]